MNIACAIRWGVDSVGIFSIERGSPYMGKAFEVLDILQWTVRIQGRKGEESWIVAL